MGQQAMIGSSVLQQLPHRPSGQGMVDDETRQALREACLAYANAAEGSEAARLNYSTWDELSLAFIEETTTPRVLIHLHRGIGRIIAPGGKAEARLLEKMVRGAGWK